MKNLLIIVILLSGFLFAQVDSTEVQILEKENKLLRGIIIDQYLELNGGDIQDAFIDLYLHCIDIEYENMKVNKTLDLAQDLINDLAALKDEKDLDAILAKYGITRKK